MQTLDSLGHAYHVVYDAGAYFPLRWQMLTPLAMSGFGLYRSIHLFRKNGTSRRDVVTRRLVLLWTFVAGVVGINTLIEGHDRFTYYRDSLRMGRVRTIEGVVSHFDPDLGVGHRYESFDVADRHFSYSQHDLFSGFHHSSSTGGPIREGLQVRIAYLDGDILRLEIADK